MRLYNTSDPSHPIDKMLVHMLEGNIEEGRKISQELEGLGPEKIPLPAGVDPRDQKMRQDTWIRHTFNKGWFALNEGRYNEGMQYLDAGRFIGVYGDHRLLTTAPLYNPAEHDLTGKSIIVNGEGGLGDEIIHARFAKVLKEKGAAKVYYTADPSLISILSRVEGIDKVIRKSELSTVPHDYWVPAFSAGWVCGLEYEDISGKPYLSVKEESREVWKTFLATDKKLKVGIRWAGNPKFEHQQFRKFAPQFLTQLDHYEDVQLYSFQRDQNVINLPQTIIDLQHALLSWEDTLAAIEQMDIMITSCTSVAHASAALGKETWIIVPVLPYHTWARNAPESTTSPYYDCVKVYRKENKNEWNDTFQRLYRDFEKRFDLPEMEMNNWDRASKSLNLGCGLKKIKNAVNVDSSDLFEPDVVFDMNSAEWPFESDEFDYVYADNVLQKMGHSGVSFMDVLKEMYRISSNGALWEITVPHPRCDVFYGDPTNIRPITVDTFYMMDRQINVSVINANQQTPLLPFIHNLDLEVVDVKLDQLTSAYGQMLESGEVKQEEMPYATNHHNNVVEKLKMMVQVHKPGRFSVDQVRQAIEEAKAKL